jgi:RNA polymerase sporulation-specific sigma factor
MEVHPSDYELIDLIRKNDEESLETLLKRYKPMVWSLVHKISQIKYTVGYDKEDLFQEGNIGLMEAIKSFREDRESPFGPFARVCVERQIRSYLRKTRTENYKLNSQAQSLDGPIYLEDEELSLIEIVSKEENDYNPIHVTMVNWAQDQIPLIKETVHDVEWKIYHMHHLGYSYKEIAERYQIKEKDVDNALQKMKRKIRDLFDTPESKW